MSQRVRTRAGIDKMPVPDDNTIPDTLLFVLPSADSNGIACALLFLDGQIHGLSTIQLDLVGKREAEKWVFDIVNQQSPLLVASNNPSGLEAAEAAHIATAANATNIGATFAAVPSGMLASRGWSDKSVRTPELERLADEDSIFHDCEHHPHLMAAVMAASAGFGVERNLRGSNGRN